MLLNNFNLYHSLWGEVALLTQYYAADQLINLTNMYDFELITPQDLVKIFLNDQKSTLDLIFLFLDLSKYLIFCTVEFTLNHESDHLFIYIILNLQMISESIISTQHVWKNMKVDTVFAKAWLLNISAQLQTTANIDSYLSYISQFTSDVISKTVPLYKSLDRAALWWSDKIYQVVISAH